MTTQLDGFETRLLTALRSEVAEREQATARPARRRRRYGWTAAAVAATAAGFLLLPGIGTTPAYSVQEGNAGEVIVEVNRPEDAAGLQQALAEHGITANITYLPALQTCAPGRYTEVDRAQPGLITSIGSSSVGVTIPPGAIREGETFVLVWSVLPLTADELAAAQEEAEPGTTVVDGFTASTEFAVAGGAVAPCEPMPAAP